MDNAIEVLAFFSGDWTGSEEIAPSRWGGGGRATGTVSARLGLGGRVLVQEYSAQRDGKTWFQAHAVITADEQTPAFGLYWFDSMGFIPASPAPGEWDGRTLRFVRSSPRGQTRHTYIPSGPDAYVFALESSFDSGATWVAVMQGSYARTKE